MATLPAEWTGVIRFGSFELDCRLFSAAGKAREYPLRTVHVQCHTALTSVTSTNNDVEATDELSGAVESDVGVPDVAIKQGKSNIQGVVQEVSDATVSIGSREQFFCPKCQRALKASEIGQAVETDIGYIAVSDDVLATLEFKPSKIAPAQFIRSDDPALDVVGVTRRLYVMPKPAAVQDYIKLHHTLADCGRVGFIPLLIMKRKPYVAVVKPLHIPESIFGAKRDVLVVDILSDTDKLRDPGDLPDFFGIIPAVDVHDAERYIEHAVHPVASPLNIDRCINPKRQMMREILASLMAKALKKKKV